MMRPDELRLKTNVLDTFERMVTDYEKLRTVSSVSLYYAGHQSTMHGVQSDGDEIVRVVKNALVDHWRDKLILEASNLRSHNIDPTSLMPEDIKW